ncbi:hypothetical protein HN51_047779, partial [Arachis hypogaea]
QKYKLERKKEDELNNAATGAAKTVVRGGSRRTELNREWLREKVLRIRGAERNTQRRRDGRGVVVVREDAGGNGVSATELV